MEDQWGGEKDVGGMFYQSKGRGRECIPPVWKIRFSDGISPKKVFPSTELLQNDNFKFPKVFFTLLLLPHLERRMARECTDFLLCTIFIILVLISTIFPSNNHVDFRFIFGHIVGTFSASSPLRRWRKVLAIFFYFFGLPSHLPSFLPPLPLTRWMVNHQPITLDNKVWFLFWHYAT